MKYESVLKDALQLEPNERAKLVEIKMESLAAPNPDMDSAWAKVAQRRYKELKTTTICNKDVNDILIKLGR